MQFVIWCVLGLVAGIIAKLIFPGRQGGGIIMTILLGVVGSLFGGWAGQKFLNIGVAGQFSPAGVATAVVGALVLLFLWGLISKKK